MFGSRRFVNRLLLISVLIGSANAPCAYGQLIASFQDDFQLTTPAPGWSYLWNADGPIGDPANYAPLTPNSSGAYTTNGSDVRPAPAPGNFLTISIQASQPGGHPGMGAAQSGSGGIERYCIALYTLPDSNRVSLLNGFLRNVNPNSGGSTDGLNLKVFINDDPLPKFSDSTAPGFDKSINFNVPLGDLSSGDRIYVAIGSRNSDLFDGFHLRYHIVAVPEPSVSLTLLVLVLCNCCHRHR